MNFLSCVLVTVALALTTAGAFAQAPDAVLLNGKIVTADGGGTVHEALAVREGRIVALGKSAEIKRVAGKETRVVDLGGRTVIPGLIDSHIHAIRAALSYGTEVHWFGTASIEEALGRLRDAARTATPGAWLVVAGGWTEEQFKERRRPTQEELLAAAPDNQLSLRRTAALLELLFRPAAGDDEPGTWLGSARRVAQAAQRFLNRLCSEPVHLGAIAQRRADRMHVRIDQPRNHRAPAKIDYARLLAGEALDRGQFTERDDAPVAHRERLVNGVALVGRDDLAVEQDGVGGLGEGGGGVED